MRRMMQDTCTWERPASRRAAGFRGSHQPGHVARYAGLLDPALTLLALLTLFALTACGGAPLAAAHGGNAGEESQGQARATIPSPSAGATNGTSIPIGNTLSDAGLRAVVDAYLAPMTLDQKIGQMMLLETYYTGDTELLSTVGPLHLGAVVIYNMNFKGLSALHGYTAALQARAEVPMLISADEEGGGVDRLALSGIPSRPSPEAIASTGDPRQAYSWGVTDARDLLAAGINTDLAPVVDVRTTWDAMEGTRLFGNTPATVDQYARAFAHGLQQHGVIACLKHWPGIGSLTQDPHHTLPVMDRTRAELESTEFAAFRGLLALHPGMIMTTHVIVPAIDPTTPADLSPLVTEDLLRGELHYDGVIMSDSLHMAGIAVRYSLGEAAVLAIRAGNDLIEGAWGRDTLIEMESAVRAAVHQGRISATRIDQAVRRILLLKARYGLLATPYKTPASGAALSSPTPPSNQAELPRSTWR